MVNIHAYMYTSDILLFVISLSLNYMLAQAMFFMFARNAILQHTT